MERQMVQPTVCPDCGGTDVRVVRVYLGHGQWLLFDECRGCDWHGPDELDCEGV